MVSSIVSVPLTLRYLGAERYGLWMAISSFIALLGFSDLGIGSGLVNAISVAHGRNDRDAAVRYTSSALAMLGAIAVGLLLIFAAVYPLVPWPRVFNASTAAAAREAGPAVAALALCFALNMPAGVVQRVQIGYQDGFAANVWQGLASLIGLAALLAAVWATAGLPWLILATSGAPLIVAALNAAAVFGWQRRWLRPRLSAVSQSAAREVAKVGLLFMVLQISIALAFSSDNLVAAQVLGLDAVPQYSVPFRMFAIPASLLGVMLAPLWPAYGEAVARGDVRWIRQTLRRSLHVSVAYGAIVSVLLVLFGKAIVRAWAGPQIHPTFTLLLGLGAWAVLYGAGNCLAMLLNGLNVVKFQMWIALVMAVTNLGLSIALAFRFGVAGIIWGTVISYGVCAMMPMAVYVPRLIRSLSELQAAEPVA